MDQPFSLPFTEDAYGCSRAGAERALPTAGSQTARVYEALAGSPLTYHELSAQTGFPLATCCARVGTLKRQGLVEAAGTKTGPCGTKNTIWAVAVSVRRSPC